jgi:hypothetical protein
VASYKRGKKAVIFHLHACLIGIELNIKRDGEILYSKYGK